MSFPELTSRAGDIVLGELRQGKVSGGLLF